MERWGERGRKGGLKLTEEATTRVGLSDPTTARNTKHNSKSTHTHTHPHRHTLHPYTQRERERETHTNHPPQADFSVILIRWAHLAAGSEPSLDQVWV